MMYVCNGLKHTQQNKNTIMQDVCFQWFEAHTQYNKNTIIHYVCLQWFEAHTQHNKNTIIHRTNVKPKHVNLRKKTTSPDLQL